MSNRRDFLKKAGFVAAVSGLQQALPFNTLAAEAKTAGEPEVKASSDYAVVETTDGKIRGYSKNGVFTFKGIPYGESTAGKNRFMPPVKKQSWDGVKDALVYGPICPQKANDGWLAQEYGFLYQWIDGYQNEDCLRLNVWSPKINDGKKRPVMFWIHGGGFFAGSSQEHPSYEGENLSRKGDVVVVSVNHRLNIFGFFDLSQYGSQYKYSGNVGMLDLVAALEWVRDNIGRFGGDKNNVTIFGQSGGGAKVITLMAMPSAKGLFHKAISQSNSIVQVSVPEYSQRITKQVLLELGLNENNIAALHDLETSRLLSAIAAADKKLGSKVPKGVGRAGLQPVVDGEVLPAHPFDPVAPPLSSDMPFMVGTTRNEASASINNPAAENLDEGGLKKQVNDRFGKSGDEIYKVLRKVHRQAKPVEILSFISAQNSMAYLQAERKSAQQAPVYLYRFDWKTPVLDGRPRSFHCSEIPFAFANTSKAENYTGNSDDAQKLAAKVSQAWINFARSGDPNHTGLPDWPDFKDQKGAMMVFDDQCKVSIDPDHEARLILQRVFYNKDI
ncbi:carboxylesterase family protein [Pedobacter sp. HMF7647]|uniref:Carboxylic ester hydrolase n=1 Tax=Hufsiella arboris TaxID=2695275 RepID=A0A7K1Y7L2_9SPHI|nr:carboxylesterase/lipase family protein [Hufsiella arboris]MXV50563.1 carboxylesterase family protein [Hufsiella arboris]